MLLLNVFSFLFFVTTIQTASFRKTKNVGVLHGHEIPIEAAPYIVSIQTPSPLKNDTYMHFCGGSIIHEKFILTAAHCLYRNITMVIKVGTATLDEGGVIYETAKKIIHNKFAIAKYDFDIGLIKLNKSIEFGKKVQKIDLTGAAELEEGTKLETAGWGVTNEEVFKGSNNLMQKTIPMITHMLCKQIHKPVPDMVINSRLICAGGLGGTSCFGDSGGPLTYNNTLVGVTSCGQHCGVYPGLYTKVSAMLSWILQTIDKNIKYGE